MDERDGDGSSRRPYDMIVGPNRFGIGLDVGWRHYCVDGVMDLWCMNTQDETTLASLIEDAKRHGYEFREVLRLEQGKADAKSAMVWRPDVLE